MAIHVQKVSFSLGAAEIFGFGCENRASSWGNVMKRFAGGIGDAPELRWKCCFVDVVFRIPRYLRCAGHFGVSGIFEFRGLHGHPLCCVLERFWGRRCPLDGKRGIVRVDDLVLRF